MIWNHPHRFILIELLFRPLSSYEYSPDSLSAESTQTPQALRLSGEYADRSVDLPPGSPLPFGMLHTVVRSQFSFRPESLAAFLTGIKRMRCTIMHLPFRLRIKHCPTFLTSKLIFSHGFFSFQLSYFILKTRTNVIPRHSI